MKLRHQYHRQQAKMIFLSKEKHTCGIHPIIGDVSRMFFIIVSIPLQSRKHIECFAQKHRAFTAKTFNVFIKNTKRFQANTFYDFRLAKLFHTDTSETISNTKAKNTLELDTFGSICIFTIYQDSVIILQTCRKRNIKYL